MLEQRRSAKARVRLHLPRGWALQDDHRRDRLLSLPFSRGPGCFVGVQEELRRPHPCPHRPRTRGREAPAPVGGAPRPYLRSSPARARGAARKPCASPQVAELRAGVLIKKRGCQRAPAGPEEQTLKPRRRRLLIPAQTWQFPHWSFWNHSFCITKIFQDLSLHPSPHFFFFFSFFLKENCFTH